MIFTMSSSICFFPDLDAPGVGLATVVYDARQGEGFTDVLEGLGCRYCLKSPGLSFILQGGGLSLQCTRVLRSMSNVKKPMYIYKESVYTSYVYINLT